jgi:hypothetical protein
MDAGDGDGRWILKDQRGWGKARRANSDKQDRCWLRLQNMLPWLLCLFVLQTWAHTIQILPSTKECFFEDLHVNDKVHLFSTSQPEADFPR